MTPSQISDPIQLNKIGLIPGPGEDAPSFCKRVERTKKRFEEGVWIPDAHWHWVREFLGELFDVKPLYICAFYSNKGLAPWQGAACWIEGRALHSIQMRGGMEKGSYLGLYSREEVLAHEAVHAARSGFHEGRFEEFFAYMASEKRWRRVLGPIVQRPWEVWLFFTAMCGGVVWPLSYLIGLFWLGAGFVRLIRNHWVLRRAVESIVGQVKDPKKGRAILFRLGDREIEALARGGKLKDVAKNDLRWKIIETYLE